MPTAKQALDWLDDLPEEVHAAEVVVVPASPVQRSARENRDEYFRSVEDELLTETIAVVRDTLRFREIDPDEEGIPDEWVKEAGLIEATKRKRVASAAWMSAKEAPVGIAVAKSVMIGITRARATEKSGPRSLNVQTVYMTAPMPTFEEKEVE